MWFGKSSLKAAALVLVGAISSMAQSGLAPLTFGDSKTDVSKWNYLLNYKMWGESAISFGNNNDFPKEDGWVGSATGSLVAVGNNPKIAGAILVGGDVKIDPDKSSGMSLTTGPVRYGGQIGNGVSVTGSTCSGNSSCSGVPQYRTDISVPRMTSWPSNLQDISTPDHGTYTIDARSGSADLYFNNINFGQESRLLVKMPKGGRVTRIFAKNLVIGQNSTHPQIVVQYDGEKGPRCHLVDDKPTNGKYDCSGGEYEGNLVIYIEKGFTLQNIDYAPIDGTIISGGTLEVICNMSFSGQLFAKNLKMGNEVKGNGFKFVPAIEIPELTLSYEDAAFKEDDTWHTIKVGLDKPATEEGVKFKYCFKFKENPVTGEHASPKDVAPKDASHAFPLCSDGPVEVTINEGEKFSKQNIYVKPLIDGFYEPSVKGEKFWLVISDVKGANVSKDNYDAQNSGFNIFVLDADALPSVSKVDTITIYEDNTHEFTKAEFNYVHKTDGIKRDFASVIITGLPTAGSLTFNDKAVTRDQEIAVADLGKLVFTPKANEFNKTKYATFTYKVRGSGTGENIDKTSGEYTATIKVLPVNDKPSVTTNDNNEVVFTVMEDGTLTGGKAEVKDVSNERNVDTYTFKIENVSGTDYTAFNNTFKLVKDNSQNATVELKSGATLNYSTKNVYTVWATVSDNAQTEKDASVTKAGPLTSDKFKIIVRIKNINDKPTISSQTFEIYEKQPDGSDWPVNTEVGLVSKASDPDGDKLTYSLPNNVPFKFITPKNGTENNLLVVKDGSQLDYETKTSWTFKVTVTDGEYEASANITVNIKDVNEKPKPDKVKNKYEINENSANGTVVGKFEVFDNDKISGSFETLKYEITGALTGAANVTTAKKNLSDIFTIEETSVKTDGTRVLEIRVKNKSLLDYEALYNSKTKNATYPATITIKDAKNTVTASTQIAILDVNEDFTATGGTFYLLEHSAGATLVCAKPHSEGVCNAGYGRVVGTDQDMYNTAFSKLTFNISENNTGDRARDAKSFIIDNNQGYIKTDANAEFEYDGDGQREYKFYVTVSDVGFSHDVLVTVNIENIEEPKIEVVAEGEVGVREDTKKNVNVDAITFKMLDKAGVICKVDDTFKKSVSNPSDECVKLTKEKVCDNLSRDELCNKLEKDEEECKKTTKDELCNEFVKDKCNELDEEEWIEVYCYKKDISYNEGLKQTCGIEDYIIGEVKQDDKVSTVGKSIFDVDEYGGIYVSSTTNLDYESLSPNNKFTVQVVVKTSGSANDVIINRTVVVTDVNEKPVSRDAVFDDVPETLGGGESVGILWATDPDSCSYTTPCRNGSHPYKFNKLNFAIVDDGSDLPFEINQSSGEITLKQSEELNYIKQKQYKFKVKISDRSQDPENPPKATSANVTINIKDVNKPSRFEVLSDLYEIDENATKGIELDGDYIVVYDDDEDDVNKLNITITDDDGTNADKLFKVDRVGYTDTEKHLTTFVIKTNTDDLDYEKLYKESENGAVFNVTLSIIDGSGTPTTAKTVLRVNDVNEDPKFKKETYTFEIDENVKEATVLGVAEATDPDIYTPKYGTLYYSLEGDDADKFDINPSTGEISTISNVKYDFETTQEYHFKVVVTDKNSEDRADVTVSLKNKPEGPILPDPPPAMAVDENSKKGTKVDVIVADDDDCKGSYKATCATPVYSLIASEVAAKDYKAFTIDKDGTIRVAADNSLNYEVKNEYYLRVVATDGDESDLADTVDLTIVINDVNDNPTFENKEYPAEVHETAKKNTFVRSVVADDEDSWTELKYELEDYESGSKDASVFKIDNDGKITLATSSLNYEKKKQYQFWVKVTDNGKAYGKKIGRTDFVDLSAKTLVTVDVINDPEPPVIEDDNKDAEFNENTAEEPLKNTEIACYKVSDPDDGQTATLLGYVKDDGKTKNADLLFDAIVKKKDGEYKVCLEVMNPSKMDYETMDHVYTIIVGVADKHQLKTEIKKTIVMNDVNEKPIIWGSLEFSFYENKGVNYPIGKLDPNDIDTSKTFRKNKFTAIGGDTDMFSITEDGWIQTKRDFDYESEKRHEFELEVSLADKDSKTYPKLKTTTTVKFKLKDMPEFPVITSTKFEVEENAEGGTSIGFLEATDPDGDTEFLFSLAQDNPYVTVYSTGEIKVLPGAKIDYEEMQKFTIKVSVKDKDGMSSKKDIVINVIDVNEAPRITPQEFKFPEDSKPGTTKGPVEAKDPDTKNKKFSDLKFYPVEEDKTFDIEPNGDIVLKDELDYESDSIYVVKVYVTDGEFNDTTDITIKVGNVIEKTKVEITRAEAGSSVYLNPDTVYTNVSEILVEWKQNGKTKSSVDPLKEGKNVIIKEYKDPHQDIKGADTLIVFYSTAAPVVDVDAKKTKVEADNIYTIVEGVDKKDSSIYVNKNNKDVRVTVKDTVTGCEFEESFNVDVVLDTVAMPNSVVKTLVDISKAQPSLDKNPSKTTEMPINGDKTKVSYEDVVNGDTVTISYYVDDKGEVIKVPVVGSNGKKKDVAVIEVSTVTVVKGKEVVVSYKADAESGEILYGDSEGNLMVDVPKSSSSKDDEKKVVDLKTGVGAFTVTYDAQGVEGNKATVSYVIDEKGKIVANDEGDRGYLVTYTYTNKFGNSADRSVFMVLDKVAPKVVIMSPKKDAVLYANYVDVDWCIAVDGDMDNCVKQDTLNFQSLNKGVNTIKRVYRDKAGNETVATIDVMMKKAKDVDIDLEKPMIIVSIDSVNKYYADNPPEKDQTYAVSILNPTTQKEKEVLKGFSGETKKGSGEEPYSGYKGHIGPTVKIDMKLPLVSAVGGLATLDDIIINSDMIPLDGVDAKDSKKVTVKEYIEEYCSAEFRESLGKSKDYSKANLYSTKARVTLWFFTTSGQFVDKYRFEQKIDDPDYVDKAGLAKFFFEMKPDLNGELRDANGRLYGTGPFIVKTEVELRSKLRCAVPPITEKSKIGDVLKSTDEMTTRFGYRRPTLRGNERAAESPKKESKKNSKKKSSSDDED